jgi:hypothetical protein
LHDLSVSLERMGDVERDLGDLEAARAVYRECLAIRQQLAIAFPGHPGFRRALQIAESRCNGLGEAA